jgi:hypothetical protein
VTRLRREWHLPRTAKSLRESRKHHEVSVEPDALNAAHAQRIRGADQRSGVGGKLVREALRRAEERGEPLVLVLGHTTYYPRFGFRPASTLGIDAPDPSLPDEVFMALPLKTYDPGLRGRVVLPPAFAEIATE